MMKGINSALLGIFLVPLCCRGFQWPEDKSARENLVPPDFPFVVAATNPAGGATNVAVVTPVTITFSETVNPGTVSYGASNGACTGSVQMSSDGFINCIGFSASAWNAANTQLTLTPATALANSTTYDIRVTTAVISTGGAALSAAFATSPGFTTAAPGALTAALTSPVDGAMGVSVSGSITVQFNYNVNAATLSYTGAGTCTGNIQLSYNSAFTSCLAVNGSASGQILTLTPALALAHNQTTYLRIQVGVQGSGGEALAADFTGSFTTAPPPALTVTLTSPAEAATGVSVSAAVVIDFSATVNTGTVSYNPTTGACSGSVQVSSDDFSSCIGIGGSVWNGSQTQLTLTPSALAPGTVYKVKVTAAVSGTAGNLLAGDFITPTGFGTAIDLVTGLTGSSSNAQSVLVWQNVAGASAYNIYWSTSPGVTTASPFVAGVSSPYSHSGLTNGAVYYYRVAGVNGAIVGGLSAEVSVTPAALRKIFVTSTVYSSNLGGLAGADSNCATRAAAAGLVGNFRAYLSTSTDDALCRILGLAGKVAANCGLPSLTTAFLQAIGPYQNTATTPVLVAGNVNDLAAGNLSAAVAANESGGNATAAFPFTGTTNGIVDGTNTCSDWTTNLLGNATVGNPGATNATWSNASGLPCTTTAVTPQALYCVAY